MNSETKGNFHFSESSSEDERSQIRQLDEERGIVSHPEVLASPKWEDDDDEDDGIAEEGAAAAILGEGDQSNRESSPTAMDIGKPATLPSEPPPAYEEVPSTSAAATATATAAATAAVAVATAATASAAAQDGQDDDKNKQQAQSAMSIGSALIGATRPIAEMINTGTNRLAGSAITQADNEAEAALKQKDEQQQRMAISTPLTDEESKLLHILHSFRPDSMSTDPRLVPFLPDYIPCVGQIDPFIKVPRPDGLDELRGIVSLDEPSIRQSDPTIVQLQIHHAAKASGESAPAKLLEHADKQSDEIRTWIANVKELHRGRRTAVAAATAGSSAVRGLPDIERLMQEWPPEVEAALNRMNVLPVDDSLDMSVEEMADTVLALLDVPVLRGDRLPSLQLLFQLFLEFRRSSHFRALHNQPPEAQSDLATL